MTAASLIGAAIVVIVMQETGLWPGTQGSLTHLRPVTPNDILR